MFRKIIIKKSVLRIRIQLNPFNLGLPDSDPFYETDQIAKKICQNLGLYRILNWPDIRPIILPDIWLNSKYRIFVLYFFCFLIFSFQLTYQHFTLTGSEKVCFF